MPAVELKSDGEGGARFFPVSGRERDANIAARYNRILTEWVTAGSCAEAVRRVGYPPQFAYRTANNFKRHHPLVVEEVKRRRIALGKKIELSQEAVVLELARIAFADIGKIVSWEDGKVIFVDSDVLDDDTLASIQEIGTDANGNLKIKMYDKKGALVDLGKFMGLGGGEGVHLATLLARLAGAPESEVLEAQRMDSREAARRVALLLRKGRELTPQS